MKIHFYKYQATGNDFVVIDNRKYKLSLTSGEIERVCDRKFGIGADGLILIEDHPTASFNLRYFNRDGSQSLCGNGCRVAVQFASRLNMINGKADFSAYDGFHRADLLPAGVIRLKMSDVNEVRMVGSDVVMNTGSPHYIRFVDDLKSFIVFEEGKRIRYSDTFKPGGVNVNFVELQPNNSIFVRTYERGVEDETLSCGTGVVAAALAASLKGYSSPVSIKTTGGDLSVEFKSGQSGIFHDIFLIGPAKMVFEGDLEL